MMFTTHWPLKVAGKSPGYKTCTESAHVCKKTLLVLWCGPFSWTSPLLDSPKDEPWKARPWAVSPTCSRLLWQPNSLPPATALVSPPGSTSRQLWSS